jgi:hypothetical protein
MTLYLTGSEPLHIPEEDIDRFEAEYRQWLSSGQPCCEFVFDKGHTTHYIRFDAIVRRETRHLHVAGTPTKPV